MINWIGLTTLTRREITRFTRIWSQTLLPSPISMTLYFVLFGSLIGPRIGELEGFSYMDFITPGLIMMAIINNSYTNVVSSFFGAKFAKNIEEMFVAPMSSHEILLGFVSGGVARGCLVGLIVLGVGLFFTDLQIHNIFIVLSVSLLTAILCSLAGLINAIFSKKFDDINIVPTFILTPLTFLGGVFFSVKMLPTFWQDVAYFNPILYLVNALRYGMLGVSDIHVTAAMSLICGFVVVFYSAAWYLLEKGIGIKS